MAISDRTRKVLWVKAGGRCSICRVLLVTEGTDRDDPSVFGEEAHIIAEASSGPRHVQLSGYDVYDNLILLCSKDHKRVDDQVGHYTPELLRQIKRDHERWVAELGETGPMKLVPDPTHPIAKYLKLCMTGSAFWDVMRGAHMFYPSWPAGLSEKQQDLIAAFFDSVRDWMDVDAFNDSYQVGCDAAKDLNTYIKDLLDVGLVVGARQRFCLLIGGVGVPSQFRVIDIEIQPLNVARMVDEDGLPFWPPSPQRAGSADDDQDDSDRREAKQAGQ